MPRHTSIGPPVWSSEQARNFLTERFEHVFGTGYVTDSLPDEHYANELREFGNRYVRWHLDAFDRVYEKIDEGMNVAAACREVQANLPSGNVSVSEDSFRNMFRRFIRTDEKDVRRMLIIGAIIENDIERAVVQCVRLSRVADPAEEFARN